MGADLAGTRNRTRTCRLGGPDRAPNWICCVMDEDDVALLPVTEVRDEHARPTCRNQTFALRRSYASRKRRRREDRVKQSWRGERVAACASPCKRRVVLRVDPQAGHPQSSP
jgi:hypothetical protein